MSALSQNKYKCTIDQEQQTLCFHSPGGSSLLGEMTSWPPFWNYDVKMKMYLRQSMRNLLEEHSCQISSRSNLKRRSLAFLRRWPQVPQKKKMSSDITMRSVPDLKTCICMIWTSGLWTLKLGWDVFPFCADVPLRNYSLAIVPLTPYPCVCLSHVSNWFQL